MKEHDEARFSASTARIDTEKCLTQKRTQKVKP